MAYRYSLPTVITVTLKIRLHEPKLELELVFTPWALRSVPNASTDEISG